MRTVFYQYLSSIVFFDKKNCYLIRRVITQKVPKGGIHYRVCVYVSVNGLGLKSGLNDWNDHDRFGCISGRLTAWSDGESDRRNPGLNSHSGNTINPIW